MADGGTTLYAMEHGGRELNPLVAAIFTAAGPAGFIAAKAGVTLLVLHDYAEISSGILAAASGITCGVAAHNAVVIRRLEKEKPPAPRRVTSDSRN